MSRSRGWAIAFIALAIAVLLLWHPTQDELSRARHDLQVEQQARRRDKAQQAARDAAFQKALAQANADRAANNQPPIVVQLPPTQNGGTPATNPPATAPTPVPSPSSTTPKVTPTTCAAGPLGAVCRVIG